ncbi:restriction endonuclease subunit S [Streptococcus infantis]|uniref:restriction endonuclease subunit S n=1 Tax=Streptococcus infantis TaxID=68892 RepID=UPI00247FE8AD|nr:restriction endonuclease subunit S [Streptococcus infantis]MDH9150197.1 restriction endonuclease subunit S [Streptococcus infantis]
MSKLSNVSSYVTEKISVDSIDISEYITTDNLLQNKRGRVIAEKLPTQKVTKFKKDDILIANIRPYLKKIWQADIEGGASSDVLVIRSNDLIDNNFLYYALTQDSFFEYVMKGSKGTKMPRGDKSQIMHFVIPDFDNDEQIKIGKLLKSIDQKIQINNQINQELEAMAKTLYDYWFVQFDFPDQNGNPYKSSGGKMVYNQELKREIPEGWVVSKVGELQIATGKRDANFGTENGKYDFWTTANSPIKADEFSFEGKAILIAGNGNFYVNFTEGKFEAYQRTYVIQSEDENMLIFMYMACLQSVEKLRKGSNGSIIKYITIGDVNNIASPYNKKVVNEFVRIYSPLIDLISKNKRQNQELTQLRDWLLPMLMNGQVKVE